MVDEDGLEEKTRIGPTKGRLREGLNVSKIDVPIPKTDVHTRIFIVGEMTGAKIGAKEVEADTIVEKIGKLTTGGIDIPCELIAAVDDSVTKEVVYSLVDEVVENS